VPCNGLHSDCTRNLKGSSFLRCWRRGRRHFALTILISTSLSWTCSGSCYSSHVKILIRLIYWFRIHRLYGYQNFNWMHRFNNSWQVIAKNVLHMGLFFWNAVWLWHKTCWSQLGEVFLPTAIILPLSQRRFPAPRPELVACVEVLSWVHVHAGVGWNWVEWVGGAVPPYQRFPLCRDLYPTLRWACTRWLCIHVVCGPCKQWHFS